jgi:hypothetical protein
MTIFETKRGDPALDPTPAIQHLKKHQAGVLTTKNPGKLVEKIIIPYPEFHRQVVVEVGITGYGNTLVEPGVPSIDQAIDDLTRLAAIVGMKRVRLRVAPVFYTDPLTGDSGLNRAEMVIQKVLSHVSIPVIIEPAYFPLGMEISFKKRGLYLNDSDFYLSNIKSKPRYMQIWYVQKILSRLQNLNLRDLRICGCAKIFEGLSPCLSLTDLSLLDLAQEGKRKGCRCQTEKIEAYPHTQRQACQHNCAYCYLNFL